VTTLEEASRCPKCLQPSKYSHEAPVPLRNKDGSRKFGVEPGTVLKVYICENVRCRWHTQVSRIIQVNPDGSIPEPETKRIKEFPARPDLVKQVQDQLDEQVRLETGDEGTAEVRR
jgi:protein involved in polysaccharide export with SLBB domain